MATASPSLILGVRTAPQQVRVALVRFEVAGACTLLNQSSENLIRTPAGFEEDIAGHLNWMYEEVGRILRQNPSVSRLALKAPEYARSNNAASRLRHYLDASVQLAATHANVSVVTRLYNQIAARKDDVRKYAEERVGRTDTNWNDEMADAIVVAWAVGR
jgi:hypothetical protein